MLLRLRGQGTVQDPMSLAEAGTELISPTKYRHKTRNKLMVNPTCKKMIKKEDPEVLLEQ